MAKVIAAIALIFLTLILALLILYYINRDWFGFVMKQIANQIDPDGDAPAIDELPPLPEKDCLRLRQIYVSSRHQSFIPGLTPMNTKLQQNATPGFMPFGQALAQTAGVSAKRSAKIRRTFISATHIPHSKTEYSESEDAAN